MLSGLRCSTLRMDLGVNLGHNDANGVLRKMPAGCRRAATTGFNWLMYSALMYL